MSAFVYSTLSSALLTLTALVGAGLLVVALDTFSIRGQSLQMILMRRRNLTLGVFFSLVILTPLLMSKLYNTTPTNLVMLEFLLQLISTFTALITIGLLWRPVNALLGKLAAQSKAVSHTTAALFTPPLQEKAFTELKLEVQPIDTALEAWDRGEISDEEVKEIQQIESLNKWVFREDETGWAELQADISAQDNTLSPKAIRLVKWELSRLHKSQHRNGTYEGRLKSLLSTATSGAQYAY